MMDRQNDQGGILELYAKLHDNEAQRGRQFEHICKWFLQNDPEYRRQLRRVWLWGEWPHRWGRDKGIDLVAEDLDGKIWAIQAKAYAPQHSITKRDIGRFLSESSFSTKRTSCPRTKRRRSAGSTGRSRSSPSDARVSGPSSRSWSRTCRFHLQS